MTAPTGGGPGFTGYEFTLGEVYGVRAWRIGPGGHLRALHVWDVDPWTSGENVAVCHANKLARGSLTMKAAGVIFTSDPRPYLRPEPTPEPDPPHPAPYEECGCGFYAYFSPPPTNLLMSVWLDSTIIGVIKGYGRTLIGTKGFRSEKAEIVALLEPSEREHQFLTRKSSARPMFVMPGVPVVDNMIDLLQVAPLRSPLDGDPKP